MSAEGFKIADAYVEVNADIDQSRMRRKIGEEVDKAAPTVRRKAEKSLGKGMLSGIGDAFSTSFIKTLTLGIAGSGSITSAFSSNPYVAAIGVALATAIIAAALPAIGAGLASGVMLGGLATVIAGGILLVKDNAKVKSAATELKNTLFDIDTEEIKTRYQAAQDALTAALRSGNRARIKEARANLAAVKKELADAEKFNAKNTSLKDAAAPFIGPVVQSLGIFRDLVKTMMPDISKAFATVAPAIVPLAQGLAGLVQKAWPGFQKMLEAGMPLLDTLAQMLPVIGTALSTFFSDIAGGGPGATVFFKDLLIWIVGLIVTTGRVIKFLSNAYIKVHDFFTSIPGWLKGAKDWFVRLWDSVSNFFVGIWRSITGFGDKTQSFFTNLAARVGMWIGGVIAWFQALPGRIWSFLSSLPGMIGDAFKRALDFALYLVGYIGGEIYIFFRDAPGKIWAFLSGLPALIGGLFTSLWDWISSETVKGWNATVAWFSALPGKVGSFFSSLWSSVTSWMSRTWSSVTSWVSKTVNDVVAWFKSLPGKASDAFTTMKNNIMGVLSGAKDWLVQAGKDIIQGLIDGIGSAMSGALDAIKHAASKIKDGFKDALGIHSPSTVMADEVGHWIPPGIAKGVKNNASVLTDAIQGLMPDVTVAGRQGAAGTASSATQTMAQRAQIIIQKLEIKGVWDFSDPAAIRRLVAMLYELLDRYEKGYA